MTGSGSMDAERAFHRAARGRRWAALLRRIRGGPAADLPVFDDGHASNGLMQPSSGIREIPLDAIKGTLEPGKAALFDGLFRPAAAARPRWQRLWLAEHRGRVLPPISVARVCDGYAVVDGHHRVSVARARGASTIDASVGGVRFA